MSESSLWQQGSVRRAEQWIDSSISQGYSATAGLTAYRAQGGAIRTQSWYDAFNEKRETVYRSGAIQDLPTEFTIPSRLWTPTSMDYTEPYVFKAKVEVFDSLGRSLGEYGITLESDDRYMSVGEWMKELGYVVTHGSPPLEVESYSIVESQWLRRE